MYIMCYIICVNLQADVSTSLHGSANHSSNGMANYWNKLNHGNTICLYIMYYTVG